MLTDFWFWVLVGAAVVCFVAFTIEFVGAF